MITPFQVYLWQQADSLNMTVTFAAFIAAIYCFVSLMCWFAGHAISLDQPMVDAASKALKRGISVLVPLLVLGIFTPSSKSVALVYVLPQIANSKAIQQDVPELYNMAIDALKHQLAPVKGPTK